MSIKGKVAAAAKKMIEATKAYEEHNRLEGNKCEVQCSLVIDAGHFSQVAGFGRMYEQLLRNEDLGHFSGKGSDPVEETDSYYRKNNIQVMRLQDSCSCGKDRKRQRRKRKASATGNSFFSA